MLWSDNKDTRLAGEEERHSTVTSQVAAIHSIACIP
jgi:hypothetical protein